LARVQNDLFDLGAELCIPGHVALKKEHVLFLEQALAHYNADLGKLQEFILPGGTRAAALAHMARTVCRRAERSVITLDKAETAHGNAAHRGDTPDAAASMESQNDGAHLPAAVNEPIKQYLNRLSDLCFVLARALNREAGRPDVLWGR